MLITFEGGEGCGKTTHLKLLAGYLRSLSKQVVVTREPGGTKLGRRLRRILLKNKPASNTAELFLFAVDRMEHVEKVVKPSLKKKMIVLCDRYTDSTYAYQSGGRGIPAGLVKLVNQISSAGIKPDLTFLLDLPVRVGLKRALVRTRFEKEIIAFHQRVRRAFRSIARRDRKRIKIIDSLKPIKTVQKEIRKICKAKI